MRFLRLCCAYKVYIIAARSVVVTRRVTAGFAALSDAFRQQKLDLAVHGTKIILRPTRKLGIQRRGQAQQELLFFALLRH